ncbi:TPA: hypothetical protein ACLG2D_005624 [Pseudomonas aeruginosa]
MSNELTDVRCPCGAEFQADSYDAGFIAGSGMCQNCDAALPPKDICTCPSGNGSLRHPCPAHPAVEQAGGDERVIGWRERILAAHPNSDPGFWTDALLVEHMAAEIADLRAALARVAELERQQPVAWMHDQPNRVDVIHRDVKDLLQRVPGSSRGIYRPLDVSEHYTIPLYAAPVVQAQQLHDLDKQCRDDVARALGLRPNQERGFAWSYLLASIKSCVKASEDSAQAQHSVPGDIMRDAQRYRWLRDQQFYFSFSTENSDAGISSCTAGMSSRFKNLSWVDAAIDSAIAAAPGKEVPQAWLDVQAERRRQITAEGWTPEHDDLYCAAELPRAAAAYILNGANDEAPAIWSFSAKWWKPRDARSNYVRAGALILAEIERLDRAAPGKEVGHE